MGVFGLWNVVAPAGLRMPPEVLSGRKLAVDASIWLVQFLTAIRDRNGQPVRNAHLVGFFTRLCRLLFHHILPVVVFDGPPPELKRRVLMQRRASRLNAEVNMKKTAKKLLANALKSAVVNRFAGSVVASERNEDRRIEASFDGDDTGITSAPQIEKNFAAITYDKPGFGSNQERVFPSQSDNSGSGSSVSLVKGGSASKNESGKFSIATKDSTESPDYSKSHSPQNRPQVVVPRVAKDPEETALLDYSDGDFYEEEEDYTYSSRRNYYRNIPNEFRGFLSERRRLDDINLPSSLLSMPKSLRSKGHQRRKTLGGGRRGEGLNESLFSRSSVFRDVEDFKEYQISGNDETRFVQLPLDAEIDPQVFEGLPAKLQYQILVQLRDAWTNDSRIKALESKNDLKAFSNIQLESYLRSVRTNQEIERVKISMAKSVELQEEEMMGGNPDPQQVYIRQPIDVDNEGPSSGPTFYKQHSGKNLPASSNKSSSGGSHNQLLSGLGMEYGMRRKNRKKWYQNLHYEPFAPLQSGKLKPDEIFDSSRFVGLYSPSVSNDSMAPHAFQEKLGFSTFSDVLTRRFEGNNERVASSSSFSQRLPPFDEEAASRGERSLMSFSNERESLRKQPEFLEKPRNLDILLDNGELNWGKLEEDEIFGKEFLEPVAYELHEHSKFEDAPTSRHSGRSSEEIPLNEENLQLKHKESAVQYAVEENSLRGEVAEDDDFTDCVVMDRSQAVEVESTTIEEAAASETISVERMPVALRSIDETIFLNNAEETLTNARIAGSLEDKRTLFQGVKERVNSELQQINKGEITTEKSAFSLDLKGYELTREDEKDFRPIASAYTSSSILSISRTAKQDRLLQAVMEPSRVARKGYQFYGFPRASSRSSEDSSPSPSVLMRRSGTKELEHDSFESLQKTVLEDSKAFSCEIEYYEAPLKDDLSLIADDALSLSIEPRYSEGSEDFGDSEDAEDGEDIEDMEDAKGSKDAAENAAKEAEDVTTTTTTKGTPLSLKASDSLPSSTPPTSTPTKFDSSLTSSSSPAASKFSFPPLSPEASLEATSLQPLEVEDSTFEAFTMRLLANDDFEAAQAELEEEKAALTEDMLRVRRSTEEVTQEMLEQVRELLQAFGIPYVDAPAEAEAQCAVMTEFGLCDGVLSDDSDALVFGGKTVFRNFFENKKMIEMYDSMDIKRKLNLDKMDLILLAELLGCDYTVGVKGIGVVNALETIRAFPTFEDLRKLKEWAESPWLGDCNEGDTQLQQNYKRAHNNYRNHWEFPDDFPSIEVFRAFESPIVDRSKETFSWSPPDVQAIHTLLSRNTSLSTERINQTLQPVIARLKNKELGMVQPRIDRFLSYLPPGSKGEVAIIKSKRMKKAIDARTEGTSLDALDSSSKKIMIPQEGKESEVLAKTKKKRADQRSVAVREKKAAKTRAAAQTGEGDIQAGAASDYLALLNHEALSASKETEILRAQDSDLSHIDIRPISGVADTKAQKRKEQNADEADIALHDLALADF